MDSKKPNVTESFKDLLRSKNLEQEFLDMSGLKSLDEFSPRNFDELTPSAPPVVAKPDVSAAPIPGKPLPKSAADASERPSPTSASDILAPFIGTHISYASRKRLSTYSPSSLMMDFIVHHINLNMVDNFYFKRSCPDFHPYILRLYFGVLFWVQCLRAAHDTGNLDPDSHQFLGQFLSIHPLESLSIPGPLVPLFKTLCSSQPEIPTYGKVYPSLPVPAGPARRSDFILHNTRSFFLPNVPGIFALLFDLNRVISDAHPVYPRKGKHTPVTNNATQATVFGHHSFPVPAERSDVERWSLCSSGLQYPCEADANMNQSFAERYENFDLPPTMANDCLYQVDHFLGLDTSMAWFSQVKSVAATVALYFEGSGTLADCAPSGIVSNQAIVELATPAVLPTAPTQSADSGALFPFSFRLSTTMRSPPALAEAMAAMAQTNVRMFQTHPYLATQGVTTIHGGFWDIRPIERSVYDDGSHLALIDAIKRMMKTKG